jgi:hypothetical protein
LLGTAPRLPVCKTCKPSNSQIATVPVLLSRQRMSVLPLPSKSPIPASTQLSGTTPRLAAWTTSNPYSSQIASVPVLPPANYAAFSVVGSIILLTSVIFVAGKPLTSASLVPSNKKSPCSAGCRLPVAQPSAFSTLVLGPSQRCSSMTNVRARMPASANGCAPVPVDTPARSKSVRREIRRPTTEQRSKFLRSVHKPINDNP